MGTHCTQNTTIFCRGETLIREYRYFCCENNSYIWKRALLPLQDLHIECNNKKHNGLVRMTGWMCHHFPCYSQVLIFDPVFVCVYKTHMRTGWCWKRQGRLRSASIFTVFSRRQRKQFYHCQERSVCKFKSEQR